MCAESNRLHLWHMCTCILNLNPTNSTEHLVHHGRDVNTTSIDVSTCSALWLVPVTSGTTCTGLHTLIRMPVLCVVFRLETGGEHPFAAPIFTIWPDLYPLLDQPLCFSPVYFLYLHPVNCVRRLQQPSWSLTHMYSMHEPPKDSKFCVQNCKRQL